jgi:hypothetical protein
MPRLLRALPAGRGIRGGADKTSREGGAVVKLHFELTPEQTIAMQPLFDAMRKSPNTGAIIGQLWEPEYAETFGFDNGVAVFEFCTPGEIRAIVDKAETETFRKTTLPHWEVRS